MEIRQDPGAAATLPRLPDDPPQEPSWPVLRPMRMRRLLVSSFALLLAVTTSGCRPHRQALPAATPAPLTHEQLWTTRAPASYAYTLIYSSMIGARYARIRVTDGKVVSASHVRGQRYLLPGTDRAVTVDGVFELVRRDQARADEVEVTYDDTWGFPAEVSVDPTKGAIDEEYAYSVRQLVALP